MHEAISFVDLIVAPVFLVLFFFLARGIVSRRIEKEPYYKYFIPGLFAKMFGGIALCLVYVFYFKGGDTLSYYHDGVCLSRLFLKNPWQAIRFIFVPLDADIWFSLDDWTGYLFYGYDLRATMVDKITWPLNFVSFGSYFGQTALLAFICYFPIWRLYKMFVYEIPNLDFQFAIAILFIPSVIFWGSGLLKDSITFACVAQFTASFHHLLKIRTKKIANILGIVIASYLLLRIKPYIFFALLPGTSLWLVGYNTSKIRNKLVRSSMIPLAIVFAVFTGYLLLLAISESLGEFSVNRVLDKAILTQQDLKQDYYQGSSFDIGEVDASIRGLLLKAPKAVLAALFRPYIWESYNPGMVVSGVENLVLLLITLWLTIRLRIYNIFLLLFRHHVLFFSIFFSVFFAFSVGLTTSNFGSLVRYKIPAIPFFVASLFIIFNTFKQLQEERKNAKAGDLQRN
ncbi:MAG: hypothetical protein RL021_1432 [Bacteroidota bacterium]|jgi:hypothetical protein